MNITFQLFFSIDATLDQLGGTQWEKHYAKPESLTSTSHQHPGEGHLASINFS